MVCKSPFCTVIINKQNRADCAATEPALKAHQTKYLKLFAYFFELMNFLVFFFILPLPNFCTITMTVTKLMITIMDSDDDIVEYDGSDTINRRKRKQINTGIGSTVDRVDVSNRLRASKATNTHLTNNKNTKAANIVTTSIPVPTPNISTSSNIIPTGSSSTSTTSRRGATNTTSPRPSNKRKLT